MKKHIFIVCLCMILCSLSFVSCAPWNTFEDLTEEFSVEQTDPEAEETTTGVEFDSIDQETSITILQYEWDGWGVSGKTLTNGALALRLIRSLDKMPTSGEWVEAVSDEVVTPGPGQYSIQRGTMWIEVGDAIFRVMRDTDQIIRVDRHMGAGYVLEADEAFWEDLYNAWYYYPMDYYKVVYENGELTTTHKYVGNSSVKIDVKSIVISPDATSHHDEDHTVTLELCSSIDQTIELYFDSHQSSDNFGSMELLEYELEKDTPITVEIPFSGWQNHRYWLTISADNTTVEVTIEPAA